MAEALLDVRGLRVSFPTAAGAVQALDGVSFGLARGRVLGVVGESGCGKSTLACAIPRLLPRGARVEGKVLLGGEDVSSASPAALRRLRGGRVGMVFQDATAALDGAFTVGSQLCETLRLYGLSRAQGKGARRRIAGAGGRGCAGAAAQAIPTRALWRAAATRDARPGAVRRAGTAHRR